MSTIASQTAATLLRPFAAVTLQPANGAALAQVGVDLTQSGDAPAGAAWLIRAAILAPSAVDIALALAATLLRCAAYEDAAPWLSRALADHPGNPSLNVAIARVEFAHGRRERSWLRLGRAAALAPSSSEVWRTAASLARNAGFLARALRAARTGVTLNPSDADALVELGQVLHSLGNGEAAERSLLRALAFIDRPDILNLLVVVRTYCSSLTSLAAAIDRGRRGSHKVINRARNLPATLAKRPLRTGYVTSDLHEHPVGHTLISLIEEHDPDDFEVVCYSGVTCSDDLTRRAIVAANLYRPIIGLSDLQVAKQVQADKIDILIHVAARFSGNRPHLAALCAVPVQMSMYDLTSNGEEVIDGWLSDPDLHPANSAERFIEPVVHVPCLYQFEPLPELALESPPARRNGFITFGSANNPSKWSPATLALWAEILGHVDRSRLWLKFHSRTADSETRSLLLDRLRQHGINPDRVDFNDSKTDKASHLAALADVDIALDPYPFAGATATFEALWMGIPVVSINGDRTVGRTSAAFLKRVELFDLIASDPPAYVSAACMLAVNLDRLASLRQTLRSRLKDTLLLKRVPYVRSIESVYQSLWKAASSRYRQMSENVTWPRS